MKFLKKKFGLSSPTYSKVIAHFSLNLHLILRKVVTSYIIVDEKGVKNGILSFKICTRIISSCRNNIAKLHLQSIHRSGDINNNVLKLRLLFDLQTIHCRSAATMEAVTIA
jgi:hypothetical protein